jgi:hypothetical protein
VRALLGQAMRLPLSQPVWAVISSPYDWRVPFVRFARAMVTTFAEARTQPARLRRHATKRGEPLAGPVGPLGQGFPSPQAS